MSRTEDRIKELEARVEKLRGQKAMLVGMVREIDAALADICSVATEGDSEQAAVSRLISSLIGQALDRIEKDD